MLVLVEPVEAIPDAIVEWAFTYRRPADRAQPLTGLDFVWELPWRD